MNMQALMQQAQKMQREMEKAQKNLEAKEFEIVSAGGGIKVTITGAKVVKNIEKDSDYRYGKNYIIPIKLNNLNVE